MTSPIIASAKEILRIEEDTIRRIRKHISRNFEKAVNRMAKCEGRVIVTGMGKPGFIARKISATLASLGTPSLYLHPAEAFHGDLGMVTSKDLIIAISHSGETDEVVKLVSEVKKWDVFLIALTSNPKSALAKHANIVLDLGVTREACPLNLAPSASTTASLAMGDALALSLVRKKKFRSEDFAQLHPGGRLGRNLLRVKDVMRSGKRNAVVKENTPLRKALVAITAARAGSCTIVNEKRRLTGIFTDGDLRRHIRKEGEMILNQPIKKLATKNPTCIQQNKLAAEALPLLRAKKIDELPVVDDEKRVVGLLDIQDLLKAGFV